MRARLLAIVAFVAVAVPAASVAAPPSAGATFTKSLRGAGISLASTAALAIDLSSGEVIYAHNETMSLVPASNEKLPVTWAALVRLGPGFRFHTDVVGVGHRVGGSWVGDLVLRGYGDPTLTTTGLAELARQLRALGIRRVTGRIRGDEAYFDRERGAPGWKDGWIGLESPPLSALVVDRAEGWPALSPPLLAAKAFRGALIENGVEVAGRPGLGVAPLDAPVLATITSKRLAKVIELANRESDNFVAEMLLKQLGATDAEVGSTARGARAVMETMAAANIPLAGVQIVDGSGLSSLDRITATALVGILRHGLTDPTLRGPFYRSLAVAGRSGTLEKRLLPLRGALRGKTGTTELSCTLSGVLERSTVFAVLENGDPVAYWAARAAQDRFVTALAKLR
jgi:D-alanyl-D-alanine carboxypeptidase/D-alanyl-D-alanine-endopeptidase (penicillin-binding protein 4)